MVLNVWDALNSLSAWLCQAIYPLIAYAYKLFYNIGTLRIIGDENISPIYNRITLILGLVMLFVVVFQLIQYIMQPDNFTDKEKGFGKVMTRMIVSILLIAFVPTIFDFAFELQSDIMSNNIIPNIVLGSQENYDENWGGYFSASVLKKFYKVNTNVNNYSCPESNNISANDVVNSNITSLAEDGRLNTLSLCLNEKSESNNEDIIQFDGIIAVVSGLLILWMLVMYCLDLGVRVIQLTYLQIIAPIPIIMYMLPKKDGAFEKWTKQCLTTFLDLFIRTAVICFVVLIISTLSNSFSDITSNVSASGQGDTTFTALLYVCLVLGVMTFAKKAGDMLKELFPKGNAASGELGISRKRLPEPVKRISGAAKGFAVGGAVGLVNKAASNISFARRGKDEKQSLKTRLANSKTAYSDAMRTANDTTKTQAERNEARKKAQAYKKEMSGIKTELNKYNTGRLIGGTVAGGLLGGANRGMLAGLTSKEGKGVTSKASKAVMQHNQAIDDWRENGGLSTADRMLSGVMQGIGISPTITYDKKKENIDKENAAYGEYSKNISAGDERLGKLIKEGKYSKASANTIKAAEEFLLAQNNAIILRTQAGNLKLSEFNGDTDKYDAEVTRLNRKAYEAEQTAMAKEKEAKKLLGQDIINDRDKTDGMKDEAFLNSIDAAQTVLKSNSELSGFAGAIFDSFEALKDLDNKAKTAKSKNSDALYEMQNSPEYKAAQANKKYNESGKK